MKPYGLMSDLHLHNWSKFSTTTATGLNSRLEAQLAEIYRCAREVKNAGGDTIFIAGDVFHVRGSVAPSVLNPTRDMLRQVNTEFGTKFQIIPGNHDLEGRESSRIGAAVTALETPWCVIHTGKSHGNMDHRVFLVPWIERIEDLKAHLERLAKTAGCPREDDLIIHAPVDGVLAHLSGGLDPKWLAGLGFKRVFAGHYHNHKEVAKDVYSIGALAHNTWSDVGSLAGFLIVHPDHAQRFASHMPSFVDVQDETDEIEVALKVDGNYARVKVRTSKTAEINAMRTWLTEQGAQGVEIIVVKDPAEERTGAAIASSFAAGASVEHSISDFIRSKISPEVQKEVEMEALKAFAEAAV